MPFFSSKPVSEDLTGLASFFDFLCAVFSRIAYSEAPMPLFLLSGVFRILPKELLVPLSQITNISQLNQDEETLFNLNSPNNTIPVRTYNGKKYVDFIPYAQKINTLIEETLQSPYYKKETDPNIKVISIADSNYGDVLVIGIKYLSNFVFTSFRGTYSTKTAQSYIQMSSLNPVKISEGTKVLKGIAKIEFEMLHTILAANNDIVTTFLKTNNTIPVFTGHSLGGALATLLDYEYCSIIEKRGAQAFAPISSQPICISFGSPRVLSKTTSEVFCSKIVANKTLVHRYSNDGDPVTALPPPGMGFYHPCSSKNDKKAGYRKLVSRDCKSSTKVSTSLARSEYTKAINCKDVEPSMLTKAMNSGPNMFDHMTYLYISFAKAADLGHLLGKSALTIETTEVGRAKGSNPEFSITSGDTEMRIVQMTGNGSSGDYTADFIDLVKLRKKGDTILNEDSMMSNKIFSDLLYSKQDKVEVSFKPDGLPIPFSKSVTDQEIEDVEDVAYQNDLKVPVDGSFEGPISEEAVIQGDIEGGRRKKNRRTRKTRKSRRTKKNKKSKRSKTRKH
jgi:hypothetical protein